MIVFCITSPNYVKYTENLLKSLNDNITDVISGIFCLGINLSPIEISRLKEKVTNTQIDISNVKIDFQKENFNLEGYAVCARAIYLPEIMNSYRKDVLYVDSDIHVMSCIDPLVKQIEGSDWAVGIRHPSVNPETGEQLVGIVAKNVLDKLNKIHTNAGVIYIKFSPENMEVVNEYKELVINEGIAWMIDQNMLNVLLTKNKDKLKIAGMSDEFISKFGSILRHFRGNNKEAKYNEYRDILKDSR